MILAEFLEAHAVAYVVRAPPVEEAVWFAGVISTAFALAGGFSPRPCIGGRRAFTLALFYLALGTWGERRRSPFADERTPLPSYGILVSGPFISAADGESVVHFPV